METLQRIGLFARGDEHDGLAGYLFDGKRAAAAGVAVHLRHDHAIEIDAVGKGLRHVNGVLAGHGIDHHVDLVRFNRGLDSLGFGHHVLIHVQAARRVDDDHVAQGIDGVAHAFLGDLHRVFALATVHAHADLVAKRLQLVGCCGAVHVARAQQRVVILLLQQVGELRRRGGFTGTLKTHEHDDVRDAAGKLQWRAFLAQQLGELVEHDLDDVLAGRERIQHLGGKAALLRALHERLHYLEVHIGFQQRHADLAHGHVDVLLG